MGKKRGNNQKNSFNDINLLNMGHQVIQTLLYPWILEGHDSNLLILGHVFTIP